MFFPIIKVWGCIGFDGKIPHIAIATIRRTYRG
jgi:hypothetical protein